MIDLKYHVFDRKYDLTPNYNIKRFCASFKSPGWNCRKTAKSFVVPALAGFKPQFPPRGGTTNDFAVLLDGIEEESDRGAADAASVLRKSARGYCAVSKMFCPETHRQGG
jgi:hypothetical protein